MNPLPLNQYKNVYFIGIGGIGMSSLARYFHAIGKKVFGYDKTPSPLTTALIEEGCDIHFEDLGSQFPLAENEWNETLFIYTPAIPKNHGELSHLQAKKQAIFKRAEILGMITRQSKGLCVAGTHGKTTTSSMLACILDQSSWKCNAFLGGIATNFNSNLVLNTRSEYAVIEADEFDRSFLQLSPFASIITAIDPDHLDIYGSPEQFEEGFRQYAMKIDPRGVLVLREGLEVPTLARKVTYALSSTTADYALSDLKWKNGKMSGTVRAKREIWPNVVFGIPGSHNAENALGCIALLNELGMSEDEIRDGIAAFRGVKRRFEVHINAPDLVFIDDYAHHPEEIKALLNAVKSLYPNEKIYGVFQPHLFSRTKDFSSGFAEQLSRLDELFLLPIYPAREEPIHGITSNWLLEMVKTKKGVFTPAEVLQQMTKVSKGVVLTIGAGDIDRIVEPIKEVLSQNLPA